MTSHLTPHHLLAAAHTRPPATIQTTHFIRTTWPKASMYLFKIRFISYSNITNNKRSPDVRVHALSYQDRISVFHLNGNDTAHTGEWRRVRSASSRDTFGSCNLIHSINMHLSRDTTGERLYTFIVILVVFILKRFDQTNYSLSYKP